MDATALALFLLSTGVSAAAQFALLTMAHPRRADGGAAQDYIL